MVHVSSTVVVCGYQDCIIEISFHYFYIDITWFFQMQARESSMEIDGE
jgi:hypothetical protein